MEESPRSGIYFHWTATLTEAFGAEELQKRQLLVPLVTTNIFTNSKKNKNKNKNSIRSKNSYLLLYYKSFAEEISFPGPFSGKKQPETSDAYCRKQPESIRLGKQICQSYKWNSVIKQYMYHRMNSSSYQIYSNNSRRGIWSYAIDILGSNRILS